MKRIRCGSGLGDSLYLQSVVRHLCKTETLEVCSDYPEIFKNLPVIISPFSRENIDILAVYTTRKNKIGTTQFEDCCISAGIKEPVELKLDWNNAEIGADKPVICVEMVRAPMGRDDGFGDELLPDFEVLQYALDCIDGYKILVGKGEPLYNFTGIDLDLTQQTSVSDLLDIASVADGFFGYPSYFIPLSESFSKPSLFIWSQKGLRSNNNFIRQVRPKKLLHKKTGKYFIDSCDKSEIKGMVDGLYR